MMTYFYYKSQFVWSVKTTWLARILWLFLRRNKDFSIYKLPYLLIFCLMKEIAFSRHIEHPECYYGTFPRYTYEERITDNGAVTFEPRLMSREEVLQSSFVAVSPDVATDGIGVPSDYQSLFDKVDELTRRVDAMDVKS